MIVSFLNIWKTFKCYFFFSSNIKVFCYVWIILIRIINYIKAYFSLGISFVFHSHLTCKLIMEDSFKRSIFFFCFYKSMIWNTFQRDKNGPYNFRKIMYFRILNLVNWMDLLLQFITWKNTSVSSCSHTWLIMEMLFYFQSTSNWQLHKDHVNTYQIFLFLYSQ